MKNISKIFICLIVPLIVLLPTLAQEDTIVRHSVMVNKFDFIQITVIAQDPNTFDPVISLLDADGNVLTTNDNHTSFDRRLAYTDAKITGFQVPETGEYIIEIGPDAVDVAFDLYIQVTERLTFGAPSTTESDIEQLYFEAGRGSVGDWWAVYFNEPSGSRDESTYVNGIDVGLVRVIGSTRETLDIATFEMNNEIIMNAIIEAHGRGVTVRIVTDDENGIEGTDSAFQQLAEAGIAVVADNRSGLMHNKFMIMDGTAVWTGSWNYTVNGTYRNNNNALVLQNEEVVATYQAEFEEMFTDGEFGSTSTDQGVVNVTAGDSEITIVFASEGDVLSTLTDVISTAQTDIRFMTFVLTSDEIGQAIEDMIAQDVTVQGIFENRGSTSNASELPRLHCAGGDMRQDGNPFVLHHKVLIIDDDTVVTGSLNFSNNALTVNDENVVIIKNRDIAALYLDEWQRLWEQATPLDDGDITCD